MFFFYFCTVRYGSTKSPVKKIGSILSILEKKTPKITAEKWDNVGLLIGDPKWETSGVVIADDLTLEAVQEAKSKNFHLIINHHPCIFPGHRGIRRISPGQPRELSSLIFECIRNDIAVYATHTNFDKCAIEVVRCVTEGLEFNARGRLFETQKEQSENPGLEVPGYGVYGNFSKKLSFAEVAQRVKNLFNIDRYCVTEPLSDSIERIAFVAGKGSAFISTALRLNCDLFVTGEVDYHDALNGARAGMAVMELGHRESELFFLKTIDQWTQNENLENIIINDRTQIIKE